MSNYSRNVCAGRLPIVAGVACLFLMACGGGQSPGSSSNSGGGSANSEPEAVQRYEPTLESLSRHEIPEWWDDSKFGIFIHWGPYSVPAYGAWATFGTDTGVEVPFYTYVPAEWYMVHQSMPGLPAYTHHLQTYGSDLVYDDFIPQFTASNFDADEWLELFDDAGAGYFVLTAKHHDGFAMWASDASGRNAVELGPQRDIVGELFDAAGRLGNRVKPGLYYSMPEFFTPAPKPIDANFDQEDPLSLAFTFDGPRNAYTQQPVEYTGQPDVADYADDIVRPHFRELISKYHPYILWCDIGGKESYFRSNEIIAEYYNDALVHRPEGVLVNNRCGNAETHRDYYSVEQGAGSSEEEPEDITERTETAKTMGESWGYDEHETREIRSSRELIISLSKTVAANSNYLLNIGPRPDGTIPDEMKERLLAIGQWLQVNSEAIRKSVPWTQSGDDLGNHFTVGENGDFYIHASDLDGHTLLVDADVPVSENAIITLLGGTGDPLSYQKADGRLTIDLPTELIMATQSSLNVQVFKVSVN